MNDLTCQTVSLKQCRFEILTRGHEYSGLGKIWIGDTLVRSGRLPLRPFFQTFSGFELSRLLLQGVSQNEDEIRIALRAEFRPLETKLMRDHSFDPIHELGDWNDHEASGGGVLTLVLRPARDEFNGVDFDGFEYHYEYSSRDKTLFYLLDKASWELDGDIEGATVYSQSSCSDPVVTFEKETAWSTEGKLFFLVEAGNQNPVMTHNLPRWASHGSFDFQFRKGSTLIGVFERVELIRSVVQREAEKPELKCFDKHIFDEANECATVPKKILLNSENRSVVGQQNLWTWIHCEVENRARAEFGLKEEPFLPRIAHNFWNHFTIDSYRDDLLPAAIATGVKQLFVDNLKKSAMTERAPLPGVFNWNMCCPHELETAPKLGGDETLKAFVNDCAVQGIQVMSWTNNAQALSSPINSSERDSKGWFILLEDARQKYGGAYASVMSIMDLGVEEAREYFVQSHRSIKERSGLNGYLFDSFYNFAMMPISYREMKPRTVWRGTLQAFKELQDAGVHFLIESFGPFGCPQHGHPSSYNLDTMFICYRVGPGDDYTTVPVEHPLGDSQPDDAATLYFSLAHMALGVLQLFKDGKRIDQTWTPQHKRALEDYHQCLTSMTTRYLQEDGQGVLWHSADKSCATLWNFKARNVALPGEVCDVTTGETLPPQGEYSLRAFHTYTMTGVGELPRQIT